MLNGTKIGRHGPGERTAILRPISWEFSDFLTALPRYG